jgi:hypothetical protein
MEHKWVLELLDALAGPDAYESDIMVALRKKAEEFEPWPQEPMADDDVAAMSAEAKELEALAAAFAYYYRAPDQRKDGRDPFVGEGWQGRTADAWPPPLKQVDAATLTVWEEAAAQTRQPLAAARLHDLLVVVRHGDVGNHIAQAVDAYLLKGEGVEHEIEKTFALARAFEITAATKQAHLQTVVVERMFSFAAESLKGEEHKPGVTLRLLEPIWQSGIEPERVGHLLQQTRLRYSDDPWTVEQVLEWERSRATPQQRDRLSREGIEMWLAKADEAEGLLRHSWLDHACQLATRWGVTDLRDDALRRMQAMSVNELGLQEFSESVELSEEARGQIEDWLDYVVDAPDVLAAFARLINYTAPSGDAEQNRQELQSQQEEFVFLSLMTPKRLGYGAMPHFEPRTEEDRADVELARIEDLNLQVRGPLAVQALVRIGTAFQLSEEELTEALGSLPRMTPGAARSLARALSHFWKQEYEAALHIALPRVETAARALLFALGETLYRPQAGDRAGGYPTLGTLLRKLRSHNLDESWYRFLRTLLIAPGIGWNIRNDRLHGLDDSEVHAVIAGLVIVGALYLIYQTPTQGEHLEATVE